MMEISRSVTIGQYVPNGSALNRLDPRVKLVGLIALIVVLLAAGSFGTLAVAVALALVVLVAARLPLGFIAGSLRPALVFLLVVYVFEVLFYQSATQGQSLLWHWQFLAVSREGLLLYARISIGVLFLYYFVNMLTFTTSLVDLADGAEALLSPLQRLGLPINELVMVLVIALKFVPLFITELERLIKAQTARGVRLDSGNLVSRALKIGPLLVPLFLSGFKRAETLTVAMEARCYRGGRGRTKRHRLHLHLRDYVALVLLCGFIAAMLYAHLRLPY